VSILSKHLDFVHRQTDYHQRKAEELKKTQPALAKKHLASVGRFKALAGDLANCDRKVDDAEIALKPVRLLRTLNLQPGELDDLPEDLIKELSADNDRVEHVIFKIIDEAGGITSLDRIIIGLYRKTGEVHKRSATTSRLYRMSQKGFVFNVPGKKGVYSTKQLTDEDAAKLFAADPEAVSAQP
jgi:hypothetical protein